MSITNDIYKENFFWKTRMKCKGHSHSCPSSHKLASGIELIINRPWLFDLTEHCG